MKYDFFFQANYNQNQAPFFHTIRETWGNKVDPMELKEYLDAEVEAAANDPMIPETIFGCQMTPSANDIISGIVMNRLTNFFFSVLNIIRF